MKERFYRIIISVAISSLIIFNSLKVSSFYVFYLLGNQVFTEVFCENVSRPELNCKGKCYLMKVTKQKQNSQKMMHLLIKITSEIVFISDVYSCQYFLKVSKKKVIVFFVNRFRDQLFLKLIDRPPINRFTA